MIRFHTFRFLVLFTQEIISNDKLFIYRHFTYGSHGGSWNLEVPRWNTVLWIWQPLIRLFKGRPRLNCLKYNFHKIRLLLNICIFSIGRNICLVNAPDRAVWIFLNPSSNLGWKGNIAGDKIYFIITYYGYWWAIPPSYIRFVRVANELRIFEIIFRILHEFCRVKVVLGGEEIKQ